MRSLYHDVKGYKEAIALIAKYTRMARASNTYYSAQYYQSRRRRRRRSHRLFASQMLGNKLDGNGGAAEANLRKGVIIKLSEYQKRYLYIPEGAGRGRCKSFAYTLI